MRASLTTGLVLLIAGLAHAAPEAVPTCGQVIQGRSAALTADLDCSSYAGDAVVLPRGGRLALNGFTVRRRLHRARVGGGASCGTSRHNNLGEPWGVCTND